MREWKKIFHANRNDKKVRIATLISDKIDFKTKAKKKDKEGHYNMTQEEDIILINIYIPNIRAYKYIKQILADVKWETDGNIIIIGDFNTPLTSMDRSCRQKVNKVKEILNDIIEELDLMSTGHYTQKKPTYTFFSGTHGTFSRIDHILGHKTSFNKFKRIEVISSIFSDHNSMKIEIN